MRFYNLYILCKQWRNYDVSSVREIVQNAVFCCG